MKTIKILFLILGLAAVGPFSFADDDNEEAKIDCENPNVRAPSGTYWQKCKKVQRTNSDIDEVLLTNTGEIYAYYSKIRKICSFAGSANSPVKDFKLSRKAEDLANAYFIQDNGSGSRDLWTIEATKLTQERIRNNQCPSANKVKLMSNIKKEGVEYRYNVVGNTKIDFYNVAMSGNKNFKAWNAISDTPIYEENNIVDYALNEKCYKSEKSYSSYAMFTLSSDGQITKVKGEPVDGRERYTADSAREVAPVVAAGGKKTRLDKFMEDKVCK